MGSYATLTLGSLDLGVTKDGLDPGLMWLFRPFDKHIERIDNRNQERLVEFVEEADIEYFDENHPFTIVEYRCTANVARDRLELRGLTRRVAEAGLRSALKVEIRMFESLADKTPDRFEAELALLRSVTVDDWLEAIRRVVEEELTKDALDAIAQSDPQLPLLRYMLSRSRGSCGLFGLDMRCLVRLAVDLVPNLEQIVYDMSDLFNTDWGEDVDDFLDYPESLISEDFILAQRVIVLTEGVTDRRFLERSLMLLYPHLVEYFHFFDFSGRRAGGGVGELANLVRALAAADVKQRILALFDNDTAARSALSNLDLDSLPDSMVVHCYPNLEVGRDYPTLGPSGEIVMDVNGLAGCLELYLGEDILRDSEGRLTPVQWTGYDRKLNAYQGEILDKQQIASAFEEKLRDCEEEPARLKQYDWDGIQAILTVMRSAFSGVDEEAILSEIEAEFEP